MAQLVKEDVIKKIIAQRKESQRGLSNQYNNTRKCIEFYNGDTMSYRDRVQFNDQFGGKKKAIVQFNSVQEQIDSVAGFMAQNRREAKFSARANSSQEATIRSKYMNAIYGYVRDNTNADQIETDLDFDMLINGYGATDTDLSYFLGKSTTDPNGEIVKARIDPMAIGWDLKAKGRNLLDARYAYYWQDYGLQEAIKLFQDADAADFAAPESDESDEGYTYNPYGGVYDKIKELSNVDWVSQEEETVRVYNHQWFEYETFYRVENPVYTATSLEDAQFLRMELEALVEAQEYVGGDLEADDMFTLDPEAEILTLSEKQRNIFIRTFGPSLKPIPFTRKCYYTAVYSGTHIFNVFKSVSQQGFSIKFKTGYYDASKKIWVGMVQSLMQPAEYYNKALTELMFTIAANSKGGVYVEEDAIEDITKFERDYARTDAVITVRPGALGTGKIQDKARPAVPTGLENIINLSLQAIQSNGVDPAFVGNVKEDGQSGIMFKRRIRQVISKMARYSDSITLYQKEDARLCDDLIRVWVENNAGTFVRITGDDYAEEFLMLSQDELAAEYDISIQEASQTPEDKQETALMLTGLGDKLAAVGNAQGMSAFYAEGLQYLNIDGDVRNRLTEVLMPNQDMVPAQVVQQLQAQLEALQSEMAQVQLQKTQADTAYTMARAQSEQAKISKTETDIVKTLEESRKIALETDIAESSTIKDVSVNL